MTFCKAKSSFQNSVIKSEDWHLGIDTIQNFQFEVAATRCRTTLSSNCVEHDESSRFKMNCVELLHRNSKLYTRISLPKCHYDVKTVTVSDRNCIDALLSDCELCI